MLQRFAHWLLGWHFWEITGNDRRRMADCVRCTVCGKTHREVKGWGA